jgi:hypothetical protein
MYVKEKTVKDKDMKEDNKLLDFNQKKTTSRFTNLTFLFLCLSLAI